MSGLFGKADPFRSRAGLRWLRMTVGILLIIGSFFWFLPILGLEMFPIGLMLIAIDVPFLRGPVARVIAWGEKAVMGMLTLWEAVGARVRRTRKREKQDGRLHARHDRP